jgi:cytochrome c oxidase subunit 4
MNEAPPSIRSYALVWAALMLLLALTLGSAYIPMGALNVTVNLGVALAKTLLVIIFFMHLRHGSALVRVFASVGFLWLLILLVLSLSDYLSRTRVPPPW